MIKKLAASQDAVRAKMKEEEEVSVECECGSFTVMYLGGDRMKKVEEEYFVCGFCVGNKEEGRIYEKEVYEQTIEEQKREFREMEERLLKQIEAQRGEIERMVVEKEKILSDIAKKVEENKTRAESVEEKLGKGLDGEENSWVEIVSRSKKMKESIDEVKCKMDQNRKEQDSAIRKAIRIVDKEKNVIIRGLEEGKEEMLEIEAILQDLAKWRGEGQKEVEKVKVEKLDRLGELKEGKIRPLKVELGSAFQVGRVLRSKAELKKKTDEWKDIFIDEDLNWEERRRRSEMRKELASMRKKGIVCFLDRGEIKVVGKNGRKETKEEENLEDLGEKEGLGREK